MHTQTVVFEVFWCLMKFILLKGMVVFAYWRAKKWRTIVIIESVEILIYTSTHLKSEHSKNIYIFARYNLYSWEKSTERKRECGRKMWSPWISGQKSHMCIYSGQSDLISWQSRTHWFTHTHTQKMFMIQKYSMEFT